MYVFICQESQDKYFSGRTAGQPGTKMELKNTFNHRKVKGKVSDCPEHHYRFDKVNNNKDMKRTFYVELIYGVVFVTY